MVPGRQFLHSQRRGSGLIAIQIHCRPRRLAVQRQRPGKSLQRKMHRLRRRRRYYIDLALRLREPLQLCRHRMLPHRYREIPYRRLPHLLPVYEDACARRLAADIESLRITHQQGLNSRQFLRFHQHFLAEFGKIIQRDLDAVLAGREMLEPQRRVSPRLCINPYFSPLRLRADFERAEGRDLLHLPLPEAQPPARLAQLRCQFSPCPPLQDDLAFGTLPRYQQRRHADRLPADVTARLRRLGQHDYPRRAVAIWEIPRRVGQYQRPQRRHLQQSVHRDCRQAVGGDLLDAHSPQLPGRHGRCYRARLPVAQSRAQSRRTIRTVKCIFAADLASGPRRVECVNLQAHILPALNHGRDMTQHRQPTQYPANQLSGHVPGVLLQSNRPRRQNQLGTHRRMHHDCLDPGPRVADYFRGSHGGQVQQRRQLVSLPQRAACTGTPAQYTIASLGEALL